jgi:hypothetical protein
MLLSDLTATGKQLVIFIEAERALPLEFDHGAQRSSRPANVVVDIMTFTFL